LDLEALLAVVADDQARGTLAVRRLHVAVPDVDRLEDVTVRVDDLVRACHGSPPARDVWLLLLRGGAPCQVPTLDRSVSVRNYGDPIAADPPGGWGGGALGNPIGLSGPPPACRLPVRLSRRTTTGFPRPHPPRPPSPRC